MWSIPGNYIELKLKGLAWDNFLLQSKISKLSLFWSLPDPIIAHQANNGFQPNNRFQAKNGFQGSNGFQGNNGFL